MPPPDRCHRCRRFLGVHGPMLHRCPPRWEVGTEGDDEGSTYYADTAEEAAEAWAKDDHVTHHWSEDVWVMPFGVVLPAADREWFRLSGELELTVYSERIAPPRGGVS